MEESGEHSGSESPNEEAEGPTREQILEKFAYKGINDSAKMNELLIECQKNFYNRLESAKLIKKQGHIPFTEHMSISKFSAHFQHF